MKVRTINNTKVYWCGRENQEKMIKDGWILEIANFRETEEELEKRLMNDGYNKIRICECATGVRGYHDIFAFVKR